MAIEPAPSPVGEREPVLPRGPQRGRRWRRSRRIAAPSGPQSHAVSTLPQPGYGLTSVQFGTEVFSTNGNGQLNVGNYRVDVN